jgi:hypothetical protein
MYWVEYCSKLEFIFILNIFPIWIPISEFYLGIV